MPRNPVKAVREGGEDAVANTSRARHHVGNIALVLELEPGLREYIGPEADLMAFDVERAHRSVQRFNQRITEFRRMA